MPWWSRRSNVEVGIKFRNWVSRFSLSHHDVSLLYLVRCGRVGPMESTFVCIGMNKLKAVRDLCLLWWAYKQIYDSLECFSSLWSCHITMILVHLSHSFGHSLSCQSSTTILNCKVLKLVVKYTLISLTLLYIIKVVGQWSSLLLYVPV